MADMLLSRSLQLIDSHYGLYSIHNLCLCHLRSFDILISCFVWVFPCLYPLVSCQLLIHFDGGALCKVYQLIYEESGCPVHHAVYSVLRGE